MIFYEAPHRLKKTLATLAEVLGNDRQAVLARELTKRYEEFSRGTLAELRDYFIDHQPRGEFVVLVAGNDHPADEQGAGEGTPVEQVDQEIERGLSTNAAIKLVAKRNRLNRQDLYREYHHIGE